MRAAKENMGIKTEPNIKLAKSISTKKVKPSEVTSSLQFNTRSSSHHPERRKSILKKTSQQTPSTVKKKVIVKFK